jgi:hypothetical protein
MCLFLVLSLPYRYLIITPRIKTVRARPIALFTLVIIDQDK